MDDQADGEELEKFYARTLMSLMAGGKKGHESRGVAFLALAETEVTK